jgi:hypothetical protein
MSTTTPPGVSPFPLVRPLIESATPLNRPGDVKPVMPVRNPPPVLAAVSKSVPISVKLRAVMIVGSKARSNWKEVRPATSAT